MPSTSAVTSNSISRKPIRKSGTLKAKLFADWSVEIEQSWQRIRTGQPLYESGFFDPEYFKAVTRVRSDVEYVLYYQGSEIVGIFPFQRINKFTGQPVGGMLNDFHGLLTRPETHIDIGQFLSTAGLRKFQFHALQTQPTEAAEQPCKQVFRTLACQHIDLSGGRTKYHKWLRKHSTTIRRQPQKTRAMIRKLGPLKLEWDCRDPAGLDTLLALKRSKYQRTRTFDILGVPWTADILKEIFLTRTEQFRGVLSVLKAGDTIVSAHFGFLCGDVLHYWFPAHDHQYGRFSPGTQLMLELTSPSSDTEFDKIELGYGESQLKDRFGNGVSSVEYGCYSHNAILRKYDQRKYLIRQALKEIPHKALLKKIVRPLWPNLGKGQFR
ncbi:MAG: GNAT family N-acetyltransferase [Pirellulaceae bacterium]|nr:GNAT family N-acetyltransferase [Pirellulaceae bacterium]